MTFVTSLILYNPLEVLVIILFCNVLENKKFEMKMLKYCYILGTIFLFIQYINLYIPNLILQFIYNVIVTLVIMPIVAYKYFKHIYKYKLLSCFYSLIFIFISSMLLTQIFNILFGEIFTNVFINCEYEFIFNIILRVVQFLLIFILYKRKCFK